MAPRALQYDNHRALALGNSCCVVRDGPPVSVEGNLHGGNTTDISIFGQESNPTTWRLAHMNLAIRSIEANLGSQPADTFLRDLHPDLVSGPDGTRVGPATVRCPLDHGYVVGT